jgi:5-(hydroxymethyl)furfural/furfural oxidase
MSRPEDPMSVVDRNGRVKGIEGLRVVDASIFLVSSCVNTNFSTLMLAEKIADAIIAGY